MYHDPSEPLPPSPQSQLSFIQGVHVELLSLCLYNRSEGEWGEGEHVQQGVCVFYSSTGWSQLPRGATVSAAISAV